MSQPDLIVVVKDDPFSDRAPRLLKAKAGTPIADLVDMAGFEQIEVDHTEASINGEVIDAELWAETPAKDHVQLVVLPQGGGDGNKVLRTVLSLAVVVAAFYLGGPIAGALGLTFQGAGAAVAAVLTTIGQLALNAILPPPSFETGAAPDPVYFIEGQRNQLRLYQTVQTVLGRHRVVPFLGARPYPEIRGDDTYYYLLVEYGPIGVEVTDRKVGDTPIENFDEVVYQSRLVASDPHPTMASRQTISETVGATLLSNDPELRRTATDVIDVDIILSFPQGLGEVDSRGNPKSHSLSLQIRYREVINPGPSETFGPWRFASQPVNPVYPPFRNISGIYGFTGLTDPGIDGLNYYGTRGNFSFTEAKPAQPFFRQIGFSLPSEGTYEIEVQRVSVDSSDAGTFDDVTWQTLLSMRDERQVLRDDVAYEVYRFKGTDETSGVIDEFNSVVGRPIPTFPDALLDQSDLSSVTAADLSETRVSSNAWEIILWAMRNGFQARLPTTDDGFNWASYAVGAKDARDRGLKFDYVVQQDINLDDLVNLIASFGGEGRVYSYNNIWTVGLDRPVPAPTHVFRDGTARNISSSKTFPEEVHAYRVRFNDARNDYRTREEIIYVGGYDELTATRFEDLPVTGKTDWDDVYRYVAQVYRNSRLQTKALTLEVPEATIDNSMRLMGRVSVASRVISKTIQTGVIRSVSESGGTVTSIELDQEVELGPSFPDFGIKWITIGANGEPTISAVSAIAIPSFDGMYSTVDLVTPVSVSGGPSGGLEYIVGPVSESMYHGLLADIESAGEDWVRLDLREYAPARFDETGVIIPPYAAAPVLPYGSRPPAPVLESIRASNLNVVVNISLPDGYEQPIREIRVWRALATPSTDPNPGLLTEFEQQPSLSPEQRKFINPPGEVGQNFVYRFQAVADSGRVGFILQTAPVEVLDALPAIQGFVAAAGVEFGAGGESKPTLIFGWTPSDDRRVSGIVLQVRQVAKDGGGTRLPEASQPAYDPVAFLSASEEFYTLRGLAGGQDYDAAVYFVGRRGEIGTLNTFQDVALAVAGTGPATSVPWSGVVDDGGRPDNNADVTGSNIAAGITGQGFGATASEGEVSNALTQLPPGIAIGAIGDIGFRANESALGAVSIGEIGVDAGTFYASGAGKVLNAGAIQVTTNFEGGGSTGLFYLVRGTVVTQTRFPGFAGHNNEYFTAIYDWSARQWLAKDNNGVNFVFTPENDDVILAVGYRESTSSSGIDWLRSIVNLWAALPEDNADPTDQNISAGFTGQGPLATSNIGEVDLGQAFNRGDNLVQNAYFADPRYGGVNAPIGWSNWQSAENLSRGYYQGRPTIYGDATNDVTLGLIQNVPITPGVTYKQRIVMARTGGTYLGAGMHISIRNSGGTAIQNQNINAATLAPAGGLVSTTHDGITVWERIWTAPATASYCLVYPMWAWTSFGAAGGGSGFQGHILEASLTPLDETERRTQTQEDGADQTGSNISAGISGQGPLATSGLSEANVNNGNQDWNDVSGANIPDDNADVTGGNTAAAIFGQGGFATANYYQQASPPSNPPDGSLWADTDDDSLYLRISGTWQLIANVSTGGGPTGLTSAFFDPSYVTGFTVGGAAGNLFPTVQFVGGTGHTFSWSFFSGDGGLSISAGGNTASPTFTGTPGFGGTITAVWQAKVEDSAGNVETALVNLYLNDIGSPS